MKKEHDFMQRKFAVVSFTYIQLGLFTGKSFSEFYHTSKLLIRIEVGFKALATETQAISVTDAYKLFQ